MQKCKRFLKVLPVLALVLVLLTTAAMAANEPFDTENFVGLVLQNNEPGTTKNDVAVKLYAGFVNPSTTSSSPRTPVYTETVDGVEYSYYTVTAGSKYTCVAKPATGYNRYNDLHHIYITAEEAAQKTVMNVTPEKRSTEGWDPSGEIRHYTDETLKNIFPSSPDLWPQYADFFTTPGFGDRGTVHKQTTQTEMMNFINGLNMGDDDMYVYILGQSAGKAFDIPLVIFTKTDLSGAKTLEEAAQLVKANGKLTVHYQAQIHGNEPAAGEAALGMIQRLDGAYGQSLLDNMNIYVIPRLSPYGAYKSQRQVYLSSSSTTDPNRDFLRLWTKETTLRMEAYNMFDPEVVFDGHEFQVASTTSQSKKRDMMMCTHFMPNHEAEYQKIALDLAFAGFAQLGKDGLGYSWYTDSVNGIGGNTGSSNTAYRASLHILMETDGIYRGLQNYERRVAAHASAATGMLAYLNENAKLVKETVRAQRDIIVENGKTYREDDVVILDGKGADDESLHIKGQWVNLDSGTIYSSNSDFGASVSSIIARSRIAPTAYVIPAGESYTAKVLERMDKQGISYDFIPEGSTISLQQYTAAALRSTGTCSEAGLTPEQSFEFPNGAYAFTMDQVDAYILAFMMEPDVTDAYNSDAEKYMGTFVYDNVIPTPTEVGGTFPIYRYIRDLNAKGEIDYSLAQFDTENFKGLVLTTTVDTISVKLYNGYADDAPEITPVHTEENTYYYEVVAGGKYKYVAKPVSGYSHYHIRKNLYITEEKLASGKYVLDVTPAERSTAGWDPWEVVKAYSDETMAAAFPSSPDLWPKYAHLFTTPLFDEGRTPHRQTTQAEMMDYINGLDGADDNMYVYILGKSGGAKAAEQFDIPVVFFTKTDLSGATTWEEAAALMKADGKLTFMYQAQIHSKEPGNGEAALAMLRDFDGAYGEGLLDNMNLCVIPRFNTWGAYKSKRTVYLNGSEKDANRDFMRLETVEVQLRNKLYNAVEPEVYYDAHECNLHPEYEQVSMRDVWISTNFTPKATGDFKDTALTISYEIFDRAKENNLSYGWYSSSINGYNPAMSTTNVAMRGTLVFLNESHGIWGGMQQIERRIMSHVTVVTAILDYINENTAAVQKVVDDQRADIVNRGKTYEESDIIVLQSDSTEHPEYFVNGKQVDTGSGEITDTVLKGKIYDVVKASRPAPTAYVIPAGESWNAAVLEKLELHGIRYYQLPANATVQLQQYTGTTTATTLTAETAVGFPNGAYVMTMAQEDSYILALLMEPDVKDLSVEKSTLAQQGLITATDNVFPIYRYIHDLNNDGTITYKIMSAAPTGLTAVGATKIGGVGKITGLDAAKTYEYRAESQSSYTAVAAGATEIADLPVGKYYVRFAATATENASADAVVEIGYGVLDEYVVYLDSANGAATNDGYTEATAVNTIDLAYSQLTALMATAPAGTTGNVIIVGTYDISGSRVLPAHDFPVLLTGGTLKLTPASGDSYPYLGIGGETTFDHITLLTSKSSYLCGEGNKLTIGENVTTGTSTLFNINGGGHYRTSATINSTDVTVKSGTWSTAYAGGYTIKTGGNASLVLENCKVSRVTNSYNASTTGDVYYSLKNVQVTYGIYCGNTNKNLVEGDVTLVLGEGVTAPEIFAGSRDGGNVTGTVTVIADGIDLETYTISGKAKNTTGTIGGLKLVVNKGQLADVADSFVTRDGVEIVLGCDQTKAATLNYSCNLDLAGHDATITVASGKTLTVCDTATGELGVLAAAGTTAPAEGFEEKTVAGGKSYPRKVTVLVGDMNGDGTKDTNDAVYLLLHVMFGESDYPIEGAQSLDVNKDGTKDTNDAVYLLLHVMFGAEDYPI